MGAPPPSAASPLQPRHEALHREVDEALVDIRARIRGHGGDVIVTDVDNDGVVTIDFLGACRGCPAQAFTFTGVVEPALMSVDGVGRVGSPRSSISPAVKRRIRRMLNLTKT